MYDEYLKSDEAIPHGFYAVLEKEIIDNGFIKTYKKYQKVIKSHPTKASLFLGPSK